MPVSPKLPPQNIEAEQSVLGALLIDQDAIIKIADKLTAEQFYRGAHKKIYEAIIALYERREPADIVTVSGELAQRGVLEEIGGEEYLTELVDKVPTAANVESYSTIVRDLALRRDLISISNDITEKAYGGAMPVKELLEDVEQRIFTISQENLVRNFWPIRDTLMTSFDKLEQLHKNKSGVRGVPTGFRDIDNKLSGLQDSNLIILAARPSMGKTSLALNISQYAAVHQQIPVGFSRLSHLGKSL